MCIERTYKLLETMLNYFNALQILVKTFQVLHQSTQKKIPELQNKFLL